MSEWATKRFWKTVAVEEVEGGFAVVLDGRRVKTPAKAPLVLPGRAMAEAVVAEWQAQDEKIDPLSMPFTRSANAAIDKVAHQHAEVADMLAAYGETDLLCYRADGPEELVRRQSADWDPALDWAAEVFGARLTAQSGVLPHPQDAVALKRLSEQVHGQSNFQLAALHDLVGISGSLILGLAAAAGWREIDALWRMSRLDELWQQEQWGEDEEAMAEAEVKRTAFVHAKRFYDLSWSHLGGIGGLPLVI